MQVNEVTVKPKAPPKKRALKRTVDDTCASGAIASMGTTQDGAEAQPSRADEEGKAASSRKVKNTGKGPAGAEGKHAPQTRQLL